MNTQCELCGYSGPFEKKYPGRGIVRCPNCSLIFYQGEADIRNLYTAGYFQGNEYLDYLGDRPILQRNFSDRIELLLRFNSGGRLLEIGSAYGFFLDLAKLHWQVQGLEIAPEAAAYARESLDLDVECVDFLTLRDEPDSYDVICMWDTLEHLAHPVSYLAKAQRWLKPGGVIAVTTGDIASLLARLQGEHWRLIHPPTHLFYFSRETVTRALAQSGMEVMYLSHVGYRRGVMAMIHGLLVGAKAAGWVRRLASIGGLNDLSIYMDLYDIMMVIARKPSNG